MKNLESRKISKDQLVTIEDLEQFKAELIETIKSLLKGNGNSPSKAWLKSHEVRKLLGISAGKLLNLRTNGTLPFSRIGGIIYYKSTDIHDLFNDGKSVR